MSRLLKSLLEDEFQANLPPSSTTRGSVELLLANELVRKIQSAFRSGSLQMGSVEQFVATLLDEFTPGIRFPHEHVLAAIAVGMSSYYSPAAEDFLTRLSRVRRSEFQVATAIARECLKRQRSIPCARKSFTLIENVGEARYDSTRAPFSAQNTRRVA